MRGNTNGADDLSGDLELSILGVAGKERPDGAVDININSTRGEINGILHTCEGEPGAVIYVGGALGGLDGPAGGLYPKLAHELSSPGGMTGLRLHYRQPGEFEECVLDVLGGVSFLRGVGAQRVVLVGHSFGAAVVIKAGELSDAVAGVAALSPQLYGTRTVERLAPRPLLIVHGTADKILDAEASKDIYSRAKEPKRLELYEGAGHGLGSCAEELFELVKGWLLETLAAGANETESGNAV
ncbi:MAG: alpha/beta hydrolase [Chloroflexi bacterium]|nr:alpha/beta hydrolase [Chloroflexota bacterium]